MRHANAAAMREEDNQKRERLKVLNQTICLPFDQPWQFKAQDVAQKTPQFQRFVQEHGDELCALRLIPEAQNLPKLRMRGYSVKRVLEWFHQQNIDHSSYRADFIPHPASTTWSTIFVVNQNGVYGEIIKGGHHQLTQGLHDDNSDPITFSYDFSDWQMSAEQPDARGHLAEILGLIKVDDAGTRQHLSKELNARFAGSYLCGYFETAASPDYGIWFIDYNRILGNLYADFSIRSGKPVSSAEIASGQTGCAGRAIGRARIVHAENLAKSDITTGEVLVCDMTTPEFLPLMQQAAAIVTDRGGILCHAAIVAREMKRPCIVGTGNATKVLQDGDLVEVDAGAGCVRTMSR
ncbi:hypothetical protein KY386_01065 [Candidatus Parcubacteria bacterium]|nr:hypothetical protein [Candidatus Parcubacteria bacterium]